MIVIGIDISKGKSTVCILSLYGEVIQSPREVFHTETELSKLIEQIQQFKSKGDVRVVMEATGVYHLPVLTRLKEADIFVCVVNPLVMKKYVSQELRRAKTDKLDSIKIANYGIDHWYRLTDYKTSQEIYDELHLLGRQYSSFMELKISCKQNMLFLLERTMPGVSKLLRGNYADREDSDKLSDFAREFWHFDNINKYSEIEFIDKYCEWAKEKGYHQSKTKATTIYALACDSIPTLASNTPSTKMLVLETIEALKHINSTLYSILSRMQELASTLPEYSTIRDMEGVGSVLAPRLIAEIGDIRRFNKAGSLIAYAGLDAPPYESGGFIATKRHISKRGSSLLRKTGYELMQCLKRIKPESSQVYQYMIKKENEGKPKKVAKIAALNKFLKIYFARVKECYEYQQPDCCP